MRGLKEVQNGFKKPTIVENLKLMELAFEVKDPKVLHRRLRGDIWHRAEVREDESFPFDPLEPFIEYGPMNREPEDAIGVIVATIAQLELGIVDNEDLVLLGVPRSATWMPEVAKQNDIFSMATIAQISKDKEDMPRDGNWKKVSIPSYLDNRAFQDKSRGEEVFYFANPDIFRKANVLIFDDLIAEGKTLLGIGKVLKEQFEVDQLLIAVTISKDMQGGRDKLIESGLFDGLAIGVRISEVRKSFSSDKPKIIFASTDS